MCNLMYILLKLCLFDRFLKDFGLNSAYAIDDIFKLTEWRLRFFDVKLNKIKLKVKSGWIVQGDVEWSILGPLIFMKLMYACISYPEKRERVRNLFPLSRF